jgi:3-deoxy-D-manno-octulosonic-acid transferase
LSLVYNFSISISLFVLKLISPFSRKIRLWLRGRKNWRQKLVDSKIGEEKDVVWFHCASLGEFEQAKPIIQQVRNQYSCVSILVTFFSPSGFEARKNTDLAEYVFYLPADTVENARDFVRLVNPKIAFFVKSEIWPNFLSALVRRNIRTLLISARFYKGQKLLKNSFLRKQLRKFTYIFVQDKVSKTLLKQCRVDSVLAGDTRFDQVLQLLETPIAYPIIEAFKGDSPLLVVGSCWEQDIEVLLPFVNNPDNHAKIILAPHDISENMLKNIASGLKVLFVRYSEVTESHDFSATKVMLIDNIGMLAYIYRYAHVAFIGGAFKQGLHNVLEPAVYGIPVVFGPETKGFPEAKEMLEAECAFSVSNKTETTTLLHGLFNDKNFHDEVGSMASSFVQSRKGATEIIMNHVHTVLAAKI